MPEERRPAPGLVLHHIGYAVRDIAVTAERYCRIFGYAVESPILHDPLQTALVQFLRLPGSHSWLELVAPDGPQSKLANSVQKRGGLHHLCYTCGPLQPAIQRLEESGLVLFSPPAPAVAFDGRLICWLMTEDFSLIELVERRSQTDSCEPVSLNP